MKKFTSCLTLSVLVWVGHTSTGLAQLPREGSHRGYFPDPRNTISSNASDMIGLGRQVPYRDGMPGIPGVQKSNDPNIPRSENSGLLQELQSRGIDMRNYAPPIKTPRPTPPIQSTPEINLDQLAPYLKDPPSYELVMLHPIPDQEKSTWLNRHWSLIILAIGGALGRVLTQRNKDAQGPYSPD